jgi:putative DNA primase/helicase
MQLYTCTLTVQQAKSVRVEDEIARRGGLSLKRRGNELVGPCPHCGGVDRFAVNTNKQIFCCRGCDAGGDIIDLVRHIDGITFKTAVQLLGVGSNGKPVARGKAKPVPVAKVADDTNVDRALAIWQEASPIAGTIAKQYLERRGLEPPPGDDVLRFYDDCPFDGSRYSCMLSLYRDIRTNEPRAIMRTAIGPAGIKIGRLSLGPTAGAAVKIDRDVDVEYGLHIGEGLETCLAARMKGLRPCWSLGSSGAIKAFPVLPGIESLTILVDNDPADRNGRRAGPDDAAVCWRRWKAAGREVRGFSTDTVGKDIADCMGAAND